MKTGPDATSRVGPCFLKIGFRRSGFGESGRIGARPGAAAPPCAVPPYFAAAAGEAPEAGAAGTARSFEAGAAGPPPLRSTGRRTVRVEPLPSGKSASAERAR